MEFIKRGYSIVKYCDFVELLRSAYTKSGKNYIQLATELEMKSPGSITNAFAPDEQAMSNENLTKLTSILGLDCYVIYGNGEKGYLVNNNSMKDL